MSTYQAKMLSIVYRYPLHKVKEDLRKKGIELEVVDASPSSWEQFFN